MALMTDQEMVGFMAAMMFAAEISKKLDVLALQKAGITDDTHWDAHIKRASALWERVKVLIAPPP